MLIHRLKKLPPQMSDFIIRVGHLADTKNIGAYLVGGFVRDLFLGVDNFDIDFVVEGDAIAFASELARVNHLKLTTHRRFGTATIEGFEGFKVDLASARKEFYEKPAALPIVSLGTIEDDLIRRDFTINAMAIKINTKGFGSLVDIYEGRSDLAHGLIRALHPTSFIDDPTRILRAIRFEQRFNFKVEKLTMGWIKDALKKDMLFNVQKHRVRDELVLIFKEQLPLKSLARLNDICGFSYICKNLKYDKQWNGFFEEVRKKFIWFNEKFCHKRHLELYIMYMSLFFYKLEMKDLKNVIFEFAFHKGESSRMVALNENFLKITKELLRKETRVSRIFQLLEPLNYETIMLISVLSKKKIIQQRIESFLCFHNGQRLYLSGEDLSRLGVKPGPVFKKILDELLHAKIDGEIRTKEEELKLAKKIAARL